MFFPSALTGSIASPSQLPATSLSVSIIIPTYNEAEAIADLLGYLGSAMAGEPALEILVVDGG